MVADNKLRGVDLLIWDLGFRILSISDLGLRISDLRNPVDFKKYRPRNL